MGSACDEISDEIDDEDDWTDVDDEVDWTGEAMLWYKIMFHKIDSYDVIYKNSEEDVDDEGDWTDVDDDDGLESNANTLMMFEDDSDESVDK